MHIHKYLCEKVEERKSNNEVHTYIPPPSAPIHTHVYTYILHAYISIIVCINKDARRDELKKPFSRVL